MKYKRFTALLTAAALLLSGCSGLTKKRSQVYTDTLFDTVVRIEILDAADELFLEGIKGKPYLIKPNIDEISRALGRKFRSRDEVIAAARELVGEEIRYVCVSMGAEGALLVTEKVAFFAPALSVEVEGVQGAGDSMVAGFCLAMEKGCGAKEMLQYAMAAAAGSLVKKGTELCGREEFEHYLPLARVEKVEE